MQALRQYGKLFAYLCAIPALGYVVFALVQAHQNSGWMEAVRKDFPLATGEALRARSLEALCASTETRRAIAGMCATQDHLAWLRMLAGATLAGTLLFLAAIKWAGQRCQGNRQLLLTFFRASTYLMTPATLLLVLAQSVLVITLLYYGPAEFLRRIPGGIILMTALGALIAVYQIIRLLFTFNHEIASDVDGKFLSAAQAPELWRFVTDTAAAVGTEPPEHIVAGTDATFFVTETLVRTEEGDARGRTLYLSIPLCQLLTKPELRSVIGHEMAHFRGQDTEFSRKFYPIYRRSAGTLERVAGAARSVGSGAYALLPAISLLSFYLESFSAAEAAISRERELAADAAGAGITSKRDLALALMKIIQNDAVWQQAYTELTESSTADKEDLPTPGELFRMLAAEHRQTADRAEQIQKLEGEQLAHPTDSHPPLRTRLEALGFTVAALYDAAGDIKPAEPSSGLIPGAEGLERELMPEFAPKSEEVQQIFAHRQAGFAAMEYYALIWNRSFLVYIHKEGLYGIRFAGAMTGNDPQFFQPALALLNDPWFTPGTPQFEKTMKEARTNFFLPIVDIADVTFDGTEKWGMAKIPHSGKLRIRLKSGKPREFVLLGDAYGDGIRRYILELRDGA